jgi:hypothetical protein
MSGWRSTAAVGLALLALAGCSKSKPVAVVAGTSQSPPATGGGAGPAPVAKPASGATKYVPRVSEKKFEQFLEGRSEADIKDITDEQVYAIMGEPTRRDSPVTATKNGQTFTIYKAYWEVPGSGITSQIAFSNGRCAGMIIGLEVTPPGATNPKKGPP